MAYILNNAIIIEYIRWTIIVIEPNGNLMSMQSIKNIFLCTQFIRGLFTGISGNGLHPINFISLMVNKFVRDIAWNAIKYIFSLDIHIAIKLSF